MNRDSISRPSAPSNDVAQRWRRLSPYRTVAALLSVALVLTLFGAGSAEAGTSKPKSKPASYLVVTLENVQVSSYNFDGSPGPSVTLDGVLHLVSQVLVADDGLPVGYTLHTNLSDASAVTADGAGSFVAVGASDGLPDECGAVDPCQPSSWTLTFRLVPDKPEAGSENVRRLGLLVDLPISTAYDRDGTLVGACVTGQNGCGMVGVVP